MKSILVPTDFSSCALDATKVAIKLAQKFGSTVHFYHQMDLPPNWSSMSEDEKESHRETLQEVENAEILLQNLRDKFSNVATKSTVAGGTLLAGVNQYVADHAIDLIVMGSHGISGKNEFFIGSNTQRLVRMVHCPVFVVKDKLEDVNFNKMVFASSFNEDEREAFLKFKSFAEAFESEIHLVAIHTSSLLDAPYIIQKGAMEAFKALAAPLDCKIHIFRDFSIDRGIRFFADEIKADLIVISNHHRHPLKRIFRLSNVEVLVNHADLPVLSIDY